MKLNNITPRQTAYNDKLETRLLTSCDRVVFQKLLPILRYNIIVECSDCLIAYFYNRFSGRYISDIIVTSFDQKSSRSSINVAMNLKILKMKSLKGNDEHCKKVQNQHNAIFILSEMLCISRICLNLVQWMIKYGRLCWFNTDITCQR